MRAKDRERSDYWSRKEGRSQVRHLIWERDGRRCSYCSRPLHRASMTIDHEIARANGGEDELGNVVACCSTCNSRKGSDSLEEFREKMKWQLSNMPHFSPDQVRYLKKWHGVELVPKDTRFWAERRRDGDPPMIRPDESYSFEGEKQRTRRKERNYG